MGLRTLFSGSQFSLLHRATNLSIPLHTHSEYILSYYMQGGSRCLSRSNGDLEFRAGNIGLLNPGDEHEDLPTQHERQYLMVKLKDEFFEELADDLGGSPQMLPCFRVPKLECDLQLKRILDALRDEADDQEVGREIFMTSLVTELGIWVLRRFCGSGLAFEKLEPHRPLAAWRLRKVLEYLGEHCTDKFDLGRIAAASGLSKYHLDRVFKQAVGLSPHCYLTALRLEKAKHLLSESNRPIAEIALELGFSDQSHFTNVFKRFIGVTPKAYRQGGAE